MNAERTSFRRASIPDAAALAAIHIGARATAHPAPLHTAQETLQWMREVVLEENEVWVALMGGACVGYLALKGDFLDQLYVAPHAQRAGLGTRLLGIAKERHDRLTLHVFQRNTLARRLYEREGFSLVELRDGSHNEENEPDAVYTWRRPKASSQG